MNTVNTSLEPSTAAPRQRRWWQRTRLWVLLSILVLIPCGHRLWQHASYSFVGYRLRSLIRPSVGIAPGTIRSINPLPRGRASSSDPFSWTKETYIVRINNDGTLARLEEAGSWDNFGSLYTDRNSNTWFVDRDRMLECQHWLIPWHFEGRVAWSVRSATREPPPDVVQVRVLTFLIQDLGPNSTRGKEIAAVRAGNDLVEWRDWLAFAMNVGLVVSSTYLFVTILRLPWLIRSRLRDYRVRRALKAGRCTKCGYDLIGTRAEAGNTTCPECGERISVDASRPASREHVHPA